LASEDVWIEDWLSAERFAPYLTKSGGRRSRALALYEWNAQLGAAFLHDLNHLEIALRNAYDRQLVHATVPGDVHWTNKNTALVLFPPHMRQGARGRKLIDVNNTPREKIATARRAAKSPVAGKVVAELMFGFWTYMTSDIHEKTLWVPYLHNAFPSNTDRGKVHGTLSEVREFRNRVAHHEPILSRPEVHRRQIVFLMRLVCPAAVGHLNTHSEVSGVLARRP
jgi:hypothetical protein